MDNQEPNRDMVDEVMDKVMGPQGEQPQESSPATEQPEGSKPAESVPAQTQEAQTQSEKDLGFATHPKWIERENKLKEARESIRLAEQREARYLKLLDELQKKQANPAPSGTKADRYQSMAEKVCAKNGWNIGQLSQEQLAYVHDQVKFTLGILDEEVPSLLDSRIKPLEESYQRMQLRDQMTQEEQSVREKAKTEFPMFDWDKHIRPAISAYLKTLDQTDPDRNIKLSYEDMFYRAITPLLKEHLEKSTRQEARDSVKQNARPLGRGPASKTTDANGKKKPFGDVLESILDANGVKP